MTAFRWHALRLTRPDRKLRRRPQPLRDWTLRARLIASFLGLLVLLCVGIGSFTAIALQHSLTGQLDSQLRRAGGRSSNAYPGSGDPAHTLAALGGNRSFLLPPGNPPGSIGAQITGGTVVEAVMLDANADRTTLSSTADPALLSIPVDGKPRSIALPGLGEYQVLARTTPDGDTLVSGFSLKSVFSTLTNLTLVITGLTALGLVIAGLVGALIVRLALRPLRRVTATATRVADMPLDEGEVALAERVPAPNPHTEVGQVGVALNRMLENVNDALNARHRSETRVRQFVADASHELRTPLASIRGYAELTRRSREVAPPDIAHAMSRVESEAGRMTTLVEDLLLLARLDAGRPLEAAEADLTRLAVDAVSDAHAAGPDHSWQLDVPDDPLVMQGDGARLHQVLTNLLANARTHTPAGTQVRVSLSQQGDRAILAVRDDGPGISPTLMPDIFERFSRGEPSRSRTAGSTGLGLAIVAAVVAAHGGRIDVTSAPGNTVFTVTLPMHGNQQASPQTFESFAGQTA